MSRDKVKNTVTKPSIQSFRREAESIFNAESAENSTTSHKYETPGLSAEDIMRLVHDLQVNQIELKLQNKALRETQIELEESRARYFDLYKLAPTGYCIASNSGIIDDVNVTTARLLGVDRGSLIKQPFGRFVFKEDQDCFLLNFLQIVESGEPQNYEIRMVKPDGEIVWVQLTCVAIVDHVGNRNVRMGLSDISDRKRIEEELYNKTAFFEAIADSPLDGVLVVDAEGKKVHQNSRLLELWDIPPEIANNPDDAVQVQHVCRQTKDPKGFVDQIKYLVSHPEIASRDEIELVNGTILDRYTAPVRSRRGYFYGRIWTFRDVTEQKRAQRSQEESLNRLKKISSRIPGVVYQLRMRSDGSFCIPYASDGLYSLFQIQPEAVIEDASPFFDFVFEDDLVGLMTTIRKSANELAPFKCEFRLQSKNKRQRWLSANAIPERESGGATLWHGYMKDVTATHEAAIELQDAKSRLEEAQALARIGNWSIEFEPAKRYWSKQLYRLFGFENSEVEPTNLEVRNTLYAEDAIKLEEAMKTASIDGTPYSLVLRLQNPDADIRYVRCEGRSRRDLTGKIVGLYGTSADVTAEVERELALKVARNQAEAANRAKSAFLANMSHEIRTPLTAILGFTEVLMEDGDLVANQQWAHNLDTISKAGKHLLTIINDILDLSKIEAEKTPVEFIETPVIDVLGEVERLFRSKASGKGVLLTTLLSTPVPNRILCDPTRLRQILMNLVGNAVKFTEAGTILISASVTTSSEDANLIIDIEDTGQGIEEEQSHMLFQAFRQADNTVTRKYGGTGLGLTISRRLASLMGGDVTLLRTEFGKGSCFRLTLPMFPVVGSQLVNRFESSDLSVGEMPRESVTVRGRILLAEDGPDNQRLISFVLKKAGAVVDVADDGQVALSMLERAQESNTPYDLLVTDMQMPVMDGYSLAKSLRSRDVKMPIIALTAHAQPEDRQKCLDAGCDDYLRKPIDKHSLLTLCAKWISERS